MSAVDTRPAQPDGRLPQNIMHFCRVLRRAGLPVGPGQVLAAIQAVETVGVEDREAFYWALFAVLVNRQDQREVFDQAFHVFWRNPDILGRVMQLLLPKVDTGVDPDQREMSRRVAEAMNPDRPGEGEAEGEPEPEIEIDAAFTWSDQEVLQGIDFEKMTAAEMAEAKKVIARMRLTMMQVPTRRFRPDPRGSRVDMRRSLRGSLRGGGAIIDLERRRPRRRHPPLVVLCDISGSMSRYSRMLLHFLHAVTNDRDRVHTFLFGTRLTNITRYLRTRDIDQALDKITQSVPDWSGGTRIGTTLDEFNRVWSRRVLGQGAIVLLITDGLDRDGADGLDDAMERLHKSCRRLIWLNPLLRYDGFQPRSSGIRAMLPHVDVFRTIHNLESLAQLAQVLDHEGPRREEGVTRWRRMLVE